MSGPLTGWCAPVAWIASLAYAAGLRLRETRLSGTLPWQAPRAVISVGNVSAGGTGKSPMVRWICDELRAMGRRPAIVLRGHRGGERSDEVLEHRAEMPGTPVAVGADRRAAIERLLRHDPTVDALVLDDAFQHRGVARDLDLVLVDALRPAIDGALLPLGWLREPAGALGRAGAVVVTRASGIDAALAACIAHHHGRPPVAWARHAWQGLRIAGQGSETAESVAWLRGREVRVVAGIGHPEAFVAQVEAAGARVVAVSRVADHQAYAPGFLARLAAGRPCDLVCTGKDWVKLAVEPVPQGMRVIRPVLQVGFEQGAEQLRALLRDALARGDSRAGR